MKFVETILAKLAVKSATAGAGTASAWTLYQSKEPDMKKLAK